MCDLAARQPLYRQRSLQEATSAWLGKGNDVLFCVNFPSCTSKRPQRKRGGFDLSIRERTSSLEIFGPCR